VKLLSYKWHNEYWYELTKLVGRKWHNKYWIWMNMIKEQNSIFMKVYFNHEW